MEERELQEKYLPKPDELMFAFTDNGKEYRIYFDGHVDGAESPTYVHNDFRIHFLRLIAELTGGKIGLAYENGRAVEVLRRGSTLEDKWKRAAALCRYVVGDSVPSDALFAAALLAIEAEYPATELRTAIGAQMRARTATEADPSDGHKAVKAAMDELRAMKSAIPPEVQARTLEGLRQRWEDSWKQQLEDEAQADDVELVVGLPNFPPEMREVIEGYQAEANQRKREITGSYGLKVYDMVYGITDSPDTTIYRRPTDDFEARDVDMKFAEPVMAYLRENNLTAANLEAIEYVDESDAVQFSWPDRVLSYRRVRDVWSAPVETTEPPTTWPVTATIKFASLCSRCSNPLDADRVSVCRGCEPDKD